MIVLVLFLAGVCGALATALVTGSGVASAAAGLLPTLAGTYQAWAAFRDDRVEASTGRGREQIADELAVAVRRQWEAEARVRRLNDPYPLPVSWEPAPGELVEEWRHITSAAAAWPSGLHSDPGAWASGPSALAGTDGAIDNVLESVPTGRLVVLGAPGSGKTVLLVRLVLSLLEQRSSGGAVPVLFSLSTWNPSEQDLESWMCEQLLQDYTALRAPVHGSLERMNWAQALITHRLLLPVLDGLDEIPAAVRPAALSQINVALSPGGKIVLSSREQEFREALAPTTSVPSKLSGAAGVALQPVRHEAVAEYLLRDSGGAGTAAATRWAPVTSHLSCGDTALAQALSTPLMLFLARTFYNPRPGEQTGSLPNPAELCDVTRFPTVSCIQQYLFDAFVPAVYRPHADPRKRPRWQAADAQRWLAFLGAHLESRLQGTTDFAWWHLRHSAPRPLVGLLIGVTSGLVGGLVAGFGADIGIGFGAGLGSGILLGFVVALPVRRISGSGQGALSGLAGGLAGGLIGGLLSGLASLLDIGFAVGPAGGIAAGLGVGLAVGPGSGPRGGLVGGAVGGATAGLMSGIGSGLPSGIVNGVGIGLAAGLTAWLAGRNEPAQRLHWSPVGAAGGLAVGCALALAAGLVAGLAAGVMVGLVTGAVGTLIAGLTGVPTDLTAAGGPKAVLRRDVRTFALIFLVMALAIGTVVDLVTGLAVTTELQLATDPTVLLTAGLAPGAAMGVISGLAIAFTQAAGGTFRLAHCWLALRGRLPWRLMHFLADAHEHRGVLRQVGAVYQFRHAELQRRVAGEESVPTRSAADANRRESEAAR
ncbi:NACHT domain-containing protein [Streptomyces lavendulae]|uniref:NACHT domain-containing protein n=1 Tax=Streptomyces lavendulae TaxID=1914 RepID=UPI0036804623